ncbi:MAG: tRNA uridine-5-carboxymethylaminomethyl(34) synthesis GTPase MnmE [Deltaproteobacteria bacterium]|nr:tRNA uridine-5-carboxymethylaminomethyl(34) synthesis GTPase MnmE [Deltaproteobacteria bacterium]
MIFDDIIAAIATAHGVAGVAVVRASGPGAFELARGIFVPAVEGDIPPRRMTYGRFVDEHGRTVDDGYFVHFPEGASFTGQEVVELHTHGGLAAPAKVLSLLAARGARMAEPGEFTRRALHTGRVDLAQAEAVLDVVHARSEAALRAARSRLAGALSGRVATIRDRLIEAKSLVEADIDFEDEDTGHVDPAEVRALLASVADDLDALCATYQRGRVYREGAYAVIAGRPNVGKSSLLNALLGRRRAIVADQPGTTRDAVEDEAILGGVPFRLVDTAGLRREAEAIESEGIEIARERMAEADLIVFVVDASAGWGDEDKQLRAELPPVPVIEVANKSDLLDDTGHDDGLLVSAKTGRDLDALIATMAATVIGDAGGEEEALLAHERHFRQCDLAAARVRDALAALDAGLSPAITALEMQDAIKALGEVLGETTPDDVLNQIFARFCIGK